MKSLDDYREEFLEPFSVKHKVTRTSEKYTPHIHDPFELMLILSDGICCLTGGGICPLEKNTLLIFNNMDLHLISMTNPGGINDRYVLTFQPELIHPLSSPDTDLLECFYFRPFADPFLLPLTGDQAEEIVTLYERLIEASAGNREAYGYSLLIQFRLGEMLVRVNSLYREKHGVGPDFRGGSSERVYRIINYLHKNYMKEISLDGLAKKFYINKFYLCTLFKSITGLSPTQYLLNCRILKAKDLLLRDYSVEEVCDLTGYNNMSHFSRSFKQRTGMSPKHYQLSGDSARNAKIL
ncbi:MAG: AraC family transcriptional regulator [Treponema sp.]|nr:AraC family transcriptional regulator [Treponema sp.]